MKRLLSNISPFLLLLIPILIAALVICVHVDREVMEPSVELNASFLSIPKYLNVRILLF
ncbi:hypothetical protein [Olivibacter sp. XZL3]|uniref:hypothetical protein n=1 Tax=Olivibacter sp. XZL3 TaxID=1735116 RepID=UPI001417067D|nr:hypothetical protein [Olivibacter sp. XZL3]